METTTFVDRHHELAEGRRLLTRTRLVTLTGPGGVGKTRLAARLAARTERAFADGVRFVHLSALHDPALVVCATADALGLRHHCAPRPSPDTLAHHVRDRRLLLVLDNCEHLLPACADLASALLRGTTGIRVPATSRHLLGGADRVRSDLAHHRPAPTPHSSLGRGLFEQAYRRGGALPLDELVSYALRQRLEHRTRTEQDKRRDTAEEAPAASAAPVAPAIPATPVALTARETEVARLVAEGLANQQIADRLVIARRTAEGHVERILSKLGFHNRSQIAAWAATQGLMTSRR